MSERTSMSENEASFTPDPAKDAALEAKLEAASARGVDLSVFASLSPEDGESFERFKAEIGFTDDDLRYMAEQSLYRMAQQVIGQKIVETLYANGCLVERDAIAGSVEAYFAAVEDGDLPAPVIPERVIEPLSKASDILPTEETEAEKLIGELGEMGFLTSVLRSGPRGTPPEVAFERYGPMVAEVATLELIDRIYERFENDDKFADDLVAYCAGIGAYYEELR